MRHWSFKSLTRARCCACGRPVSILRTPKSMGDVPEPAAGDNGWLCARCVIALLTAVGMKCREVGV